MGSSTIMVIFLGPPACRQTESPDRGNENRESEKRSVRLSSRGGDLAPRGSPVLKEGHSYEKPHRAHTPAGPSAQVSSDSLFQCRLPWFLESRWMRTWGQGSITCSDPWTTADTRPAAGDVKGDSSPKHSLHLRKLMGRQALLGRFFFFF